MPIKQTLRKHRKDLLKKKNVLAVGLGYKTKDGLNTGKLSIVCSVEKKLPVSEISKKDLVPAEIEGILTDVVETGKLKALRENRAFPYNDFKKARTDRWRPAPGGVSIGHENITAGTLGCLVKKKGEIFILSNNHVLAASNEGSIGSAILQPGKYDGGSLKDRIATLTEFVEIKWLGGEGCGISKALASAANIAARAAASKSRLQAIRQEEAFNLVDAAIARPIQDESVMNEILDIGIPSGGLNLTPELGLQIQKSGRTTEITQDEVIQIDVTAQVQYGEGKIALFEDQIMAGPMSSPGDSGSIVLDMQKNLVGLLFAGSDQVTILNRIKHVFDLLGLRLL